MSPRHRAGEHLPLPDPGGGGVAPAGGDGGDPHPWLADCLTLTATGDLTQSEGWRQGMFYPQDPAARLAVLAAGLTPGCKVLDACAAPGGKSFAAAMVMGDRGEIHACDLHPHKKALIQAGADRLGLQSITPRWPMGKSPARGGGGL